METHQGETGEGEASGKEKMRACVCVWSLMCLCVAGILCWSRKIYVTKGKEERDWRGDQAKRVENQ